MFPKEKIIEERHVTLKYYAKIREITGKKEERISFPNRLGVSELFAILFSSYGSKFKEYVVREDGKLRENIGVLVNGSPIELDSKDVRINDSDVVVILPPIAGG